MKDFLIKIHLIEDLIIEIPVSKNDFITAFKKNVDYSNLSFGNSLFEAFESSKNNYKGHIDNQRFKIRKRRKFFDTNRSYTVCEGTITEQINGILIKAELVGFNKKWLFLIPLLLLFYTIFLFNFALIDDTPNFFVIFIVIHAMLMFGIPYFLIRNSIKSTRYNLECDFHYWVSKI